VFSVVNIMLRILTVTLNPALDEVYTVPGFAAGKLNRPDSKVTSAGGKGINVARAYRALGGDAVATGLIGGRAGAGTSDRLTAEGMPTAFVRIAGESRTCVKVADTETGSHTEVNEYGPEVSDSEYAELVGSLRELIPAFGMVVLSGSVPRGVPDTVYADLIRLSQDELGVPVVLDASGDALRLGIAARPEIVKPNWEESAVLGMGRKSWLSAAAELRIRFGLSNAIVTAGSRGAVIATNAGSWRATPPAIAAGSALGSGDSLTAGVLSLWDTAVAAQALRFGVAAGAVNATGLSPGCLSRDAVAEMDTRVVLSRLDEPRRDP
jgi:tagatose 6-phosphate kinase